MKHLFSFISEEGNEQLQNLIQTCPHNIDLTEINNALWVKETSNELMKILDIKDKALKMEQEIFSQNTAYPTLFLLALKNVISKLIV